jgi:glucose/mannose-6-phosphate isomerase
MNNSNQFDFNQAIKELDKQGAIDSVEQLGSQIQQIWELSKQVEFDASYNDIDKVVVNGMGGSIIGTHVIQTVFKDELKIPVIALSDYTLPEYVNEKTLFIASSYSGNTEETLSSVVDAQQKKAKIAGICSGAKLGKFLTENDYPALIFEPKYTPNKSPRMGLGYSIFGQMALLAKLGVLPVSEQDYDQVMEAVATAQLSFNRHIETSENPAKMLAYNFISRIPIVTAAEHLEGAVHVFANQLHENAKNYAEFRVIPEINHHLMEGLQFPKSNDESLLFFTIHSDLYLESNQTRIDLTEQVVERNQLSTVSHKLESKTKLAQAFELLIFASYTSYYLALLNGQDPTPNPWVDWFKDQLKKN